MRLCPTLSNSAPTAPPVHSTAACCTHLSLAHHNPHNQYPAQYLDPHAYQGRYQLTADPIRLILDRLHHLRMPIPNTRNSSPSDRINQRLPVLQRHIDPLRAHSDGWPPRRTMQDRRRSRGYERRFQVFARRCGGAVRGGGGEDFGGRSRSHGFRCSLRTRSEREDGVYKTRTSAIRLKAETSRSIVAEAFYVPSTQITAQWEDVESEKR